MNKKTFPGGKSAKQRKRESDLKSIRAAVRPMLLRRSFNAFALAVLVEMALLGVGFAYIKHELKGPDFKEYVKRVDPGLWLLCMPAPFIAGRIRFITDTVEVDHAASTVWDELKGLYKKDDRGFADRLLRGPSPVSLDLEIGFLEWRERKWHPVYGEVLKNMSSVNPQLFERLMSGETDPGYQEYAIAVIRGHLKTHPDDFRRVLATYDVSSMPKSLTRKYGIRIR